MAHPSAVLEAYIRQAAATRGIDPNVAVAVARSEGGLSNPVQQSYAPNPHGPGREPSYGPFQLYVSGQGRGLGDRAVAAGIDPRDPNQWQRGVDFALNEAAQKGWGQWYGAAHAGIGNFSGIHGAHPAGVAPAASILHPEIDPQPAGSPTPVNAGGQPDIPTPGDVPDAPQSPLGKLFAAMGGGGGAMDASGAGYSPSMATSTGDMASMAAATSAERAKQLAAALAPNIDQFAALRPRPIQSPPMFG